MERLPAVAAIVIDFIQRLPAEQSERAEPLSGVLTEQRRLFEPEIEKYQGLITSHASGELVALFQKPVSAVICAISLHRMYAALSQTVQELDRYQLRIGIHAEANTSDRPQAQQNCIEMARALKERASRESIFISSAVASTIEKAWPVDLKPAGEHKLGATVEPLGVFEVIPPRIKPLRTKRQFARLRLPLAAALALIIMGGSGYGYLLQTGAIEWLPAPWSETTLRTAQQQVVLGSRESSANPEVPISGREILQRAGSPAEPPLETSSTEDREATKTAAADESVKGAAIAIEAPPHPLAMAPMQEVSSAVPQRPEEQQQLQKQRKASEEGARITLLSPEKPAERQGPPTQSLSPAPSNHSELDAPTESVTPKTVPSAAPASRKRQELQEPKSESSLALAVSNPKPRARPAQLSPSPTQPAIRQIEQGASPSPASSTKTTLSGMTGLPATQAEDSVTIPSEQPTAQQKIRGESGRVAASVPATKPPAPALQSSANARAKLLKPEQGPSAIPPSTQLSHSPSPQVEPSTAAGSGPQARLPEPRAILPAQGKSTAPEQPGSQSTEMRTATVPQSHRTKISSTTPERVARAEQIAAVEAPPSETFDKQRATQDATGPRVLVAAEPQAPQARLEIETGQAEAQMQPRYGCQFLRKAFERGTLVPNVDRAAYKRFLKCHRLKIDQKQQGSIRVATKSPSQQTSQQNDGSTKSGNGRSGGSGRSGGKSNGRGKSKGN